MRSNIAKDTTTGAILGSRVLPGATQVLAGSRSVKDVGDGARTDQDQRPSTARSHLGRADRDRRLQEQESPARASSALDPVSMKAGPLSSRESEF